MEASIAALGAVVGSDAILTGSAIHERYQSPWTRLGAPLALLRPASTRAVVDILRLASAAGVSVAPWGGRTGLVDGCLADGALALSLNRMAEVQAIDCVTETIASRPQTSQASPEAPSLGGRATTGVCRRINRATRASRT